MLKFKTKFLSILSFLLVTALPAVAQDDGRAPGAVAVKGLVIDKDGAAVIGAAVIPAGRQSDGVTTDIDGKFSITAQKGEVLRITAMGFRDEEITVISSMPSVTVTLDDDITILDEVIVVGYGVQKRSDITGAISSVDAEKAKSVPTSSIAEMLRGAAAGIQVNVGSAAPGGSSSILIRRRLQDQPHGDSQVRPDQSDGTSRHQQYRYDNH